MNRPFSQQAPSVDTPAPFKPVIIMTCACGDTYRLGRSGTIIGCDRCLGITRNADGMIIPDPFAEVFITKTEAGDSHGS